MLTRTIIRAKTPCIIQNDVKLDEDMNFIRSFFNITNQLK
jgi:hypothetical protein